MKKQVLFTLALATVFGAYAQNKKAIPAVPSWANKAVVTSRGSVIHDNYVPLRKTNPTTSAVRSNSHAAAKNGGGNSVFSAAENVIGTTLFDLQTNSSTYPRLVNNGDGTMSAAWTFVPIGGTSGNDRGTGYNYFNGTSWGPFPTVRLEGAERTGFVNMVVTGSGQEASFGHSSTTHSVLYTNRAAKGTGAWTNNAGALKTGGLDNTDTWARVVTGGTNNQTIHCIVNDDLQGTAGGTLIYSRSTDDGLTWSPLRDTIPGMGLGSYPFLLGGDAYNIATNGNTVAIVIGDISTDLALWKSTDNGSTWTKTQITAQFAGGSYNPDGNISDINNDGVADTVLTTGADVNVVVDNAGTCHVFWGLMEMLDDDPTVGVTDFSVFLGTNGIGYWNETMPAPISQVNVVGSAIDWNGNGVLDIPSTPNPNWLPGTAATELFWGRYVNMGIAAIPSAAVDANNNLYLSFMALDESSDTGYYKTHYQVYIVTSTDGGTTWSDPYNVVTAGGAGPSDSLSYEAVYPSIAKLVDGTVHLEYMRDYYPGNAFGSDNDVALNDATNVNDIVVVNVTIGELGVVGVNEIASTSASTLSVTQNTPNPFNGISSFSVTIKSGSDVTVDILNALGQTVLSNKYDRLSAGTHILNLDATELNAGVYYYSVKAGDQVVTNKMIVK